jgi:hypothetical protein
MSEGATELVYRHARGLGEGMTKASTAINELLMVADRDRAVIEGALKLARENAGEETQDATEDSQADSDAPGPQAPALLAVRLLEQALEELTR